MTHLLPSKSSTLKQKRLIKKYRDRSLRLLEKINPSEKRGVYHQSEALFTGLLYYCLKKSKCYDEVMSAPALSL
jgi:hypothetical protein